MDTTDIERNTVKKMENLPGSSYSLSKILCLDQLTGWGSFYLENSNVRKVKIFLEEFRDLVAQFTNVQPAILPVSTKEDKILLLKCLFIKHFLHDDFQSIEIGTDLTECLTFELDEKVRNILQEKDFPKYERITVFTLFDMQKKDVQGHYMPTLMAQLLSNSINYNRLMIISMLEFDYIDLLNKIERKAHSSDAILERVHTKGHHKSKPKR